MDSDRHDDELALAEQQYNISVSRKCKVMRKVLNERLDAFLTSNNMEVGKGNERQKQLRMMSWTFVERGEPLPKGFELLPCAASNSEVFQLTHFINALLFTKTSATLPWSTEQVEVTPIVRMGRDEMECLEAKAALYTNLILYLGEGTTKTTKTEGTYKAITLSDLYVLLLEIKETLSEGKKMKGGKR